MTQGLNPDALFLTFVRIFDLRKTIGKCQILSLLKMILSLKLQV